MNAIQAVWPPSFEFWMSGEPLRTFFRVFNKWLRGRWSAREEVGDFERYNLQNQEKGPWLDRAQIAADFVRQVVDDSHRPDLMLADVGCGDQKLLQVLRQRGLGVEYSGFDLLPQAGSVTPFDLSREALPRPVDVAVVLGVLEYLPDIHVALHSLEKRCTYLIISHAANDLTNRTEAEVRRLNWVTYLSISEFSSELISGGFDIIEERVTPDRKSMVWLCKRSNPTPLISMG